MKYLVSVNGREYVCDSIIEAIRQCKFLSSVYGDGSFIYKIIRI